MIQRMSNILFNGYLFGAATYIVANAYGDSKRYLEKYRNNELDQYEYKRFKNEYDAAQHGLYESLPIYLMGSWAWPLFAPLTIIPYIITKPNKVNLEKKK
jgi:hypothetical protein